MNVLQRMLGRKPRKLPKYIYISDAKVDMLFGSIPRPLLKKVAGKLKISVGVIETELEVEADRNTEHRVQRLEVVVEYLRQNHAIGTVDQPDEYLEDELNMTWGPVDEAVFFGGMTDQTVVGLGGSLKHIIGAAAGSGVMSASYANVLLMRLRQQGAKPRAGAVDPSLGLVESAVTHLRGPREPLRFFAEPLLSGPSTRTAPLIGDDRPQTKVLLATPLFVARAWGVDRNDARD